MKFGRRPPAKSTTLTGTFSAQAVYSLHIILLAKDHFILELDVKVALKVTNSAVDKNN